MKKLFLYGCTALALLACSDQDNATEPTEIVTRTEPSPTPAEPRLLSMSFSTDANPMQLTADVKGEIIGDSIVECWVPNIMSSKQLIADFTFEGQQVSIDGVPAVSGTSVADFKQPVVLTVTSDSLSKDYTVYVHAFTGLPVMWIETEGREDITSKEVYLRAAFRLVEDVYTRAAGDVTEDSVSIKGRGNTTWGMPKKPYRLKFDAKQALLDMPKDKSWVLLNNYADKTMLRTQTAFYMGSISNLDYTPRSHFVELMLNGRYNGTYQLCEKLKIAKHRVNVGDDGFLLEINARATSEEDSRYFMTNHLNGIPVDVKEPDVEYDDENYNYIKNYVLTAEEALYADNFKDPVEGWQKYFDMDSFVEWYLINEITKNNDAYLWSSCYINVERGGKLKMGPLWDFDIAIGNVNYNKNFISDGFYIKYSTWFSRLFQDPVFVAKVKERFNYFYSRQGDIMREINANAAYLKYAVQENENKWHTFYTYTWPNYDIWGSYQNEV